MGVALLADAVLHDAVVHLYLQYTSTNQQQLLHE